MAKFAPLSLIIIASLLISTTVLASHNSGNWKRGRIYYRMVCTTCHVSETGNAISPADRKIAEWKEYMDNNQHASNDKAHSNVSYYTSVEYRESIKDNNKAASKFIKVPDAELFNDIRAFVIHTAKDSDNPARCK